MESLLLQNFFSLSTPLLKTANYQFDNRILKYKEDHVPVMTEKYLLGGTFQNNT